MPPAVQGGQQSGIVQLHSGGGDLALVAQSETFARSVYNAQAKGLRFSVKAEVTLLLMMVIEKG